MLHPMHNRKRRLALLAVPLLACTAALTARGHAPPDAVRVQKPDAGDAGGGLDAAAAEWLAAAYTRSARTIIGAQPLTLEGIDASLILIEDATALNDDHPGIWRAALELAMLGEDDVLRRRALQRLGELVPDDETIQLMRLNDAISRHQQVEQRVAAYEQLLTGPSSEALDPAIASRLALDFALLLRRMGDIEGFAEWLGEATARDQSNRQAAALAAGYFTANVNDPVARAELLINLLLADPADLAAQLDLAELLLERGAYGGARTLYEAALQTADAAERPMGLDLAADIVLAQWAAGDVDAARATLLRHQRLANEVLATMMQRQNPQRTALERANTRALLTPVLAVVNAVMTARTGEPGEAAEALELAQAACSSLIKRMQQDLAAAQAAGNALDPDQAADGADGPAAPDVTPQDVAEVHLQQAWVTAWVGGDPAVVHGALDAAESLAPLGEHVRQRFEGWLAYHAGDVQRAIDQLEPIAGEDAAARIGLGVALMDAGRRADGARHLLAAARQQPGTLIGVWANDVLTEVLGQRAPLSDLAVQLNDLVRSMPPGLLMLAAEYRRAIGLRLRPTQQEFAPFEPPMLELELSNDSTIPIGVSAEGPLRPQALLIQSMQLAWGGDTPMPVSITEIDRRLRLEPRERITIPIDLSLLPFGGVTAINPVPGGIGRVRAISNFRAEMQPIGRQSMMVYHPGPLGMEVQSPPIRIRGARITDAWLESAIEALRTPDSRDDLTQLAMLYHVVAPNSPTARSVGDLDESLVEEARQLLPQAYEALPPTAQAWLLSILPLNIAPSDAVQAAATSDEPMLRIAYLLHHVALPTDEGLRAALRDADPRVKRIAQYTDQTLRVLQDRFGSSGSSGSR